MSAAAAFDQAAVRHNSGSNSDGCGYGDNCTLQENTAAPVLAAGPLEAQQFMDDRTGCLGPASGMATGVKHAAADVLQAATAAHEHVPTHGHDAHSAPLASHKSQGTYIVLKVLCA